MSSTILEFEVDVGYGSIACKQWCEDGTTKTKFLAVHGWLDNAGAFDPLMEHFATEGLTLHCVLYMYISLWVARFFLRALLHCYIDSNFVRLQLD